MPATVDQKIAEARDVFSSPKPRRLGARIAAAILRVDRIAKAGHNDNQNYDFVRESDVMACVRGVLAEEGVIVVPRVPRVEFRQVPTKTGVASVTDVYPVFAVMATDTDEAWECPWYGCGADVTDKGGNKAITSAEKYFLLKLLKIPTGTDPDADSEDSVSVKAKKPSGVAEFDPVPEDKAAERRKEVIGRAMELSDRTKEKVDDVIKKASAANDQGGKVRSFDGKTIHEVKNVAWLERTLNRLLDELAKSETRALSPASDEDPF